jgi:hypothetical protein
VTTEDVKYADLSMGKETERQRDRGTEGQRGYKGRKGKMLRVWM